MTTGPQVGPLPPVGEQEIDLKQLFASLQRQWKLIVAVSAGAVGVSGLLTLIDKPFWQAEFQIVLAKDKQVGALGSILSQNEELGSLIGLSGGDRSGAGGQKTEVKILESPSVLLPVFEWVKGRKPVAAADRMRFKKWVARSVQVEAEKGTSVLNVSYRDTDKALALQATRRISQAYQNYSGRQRRRELSTVISYLEEQIRVIRPQAFASSRSAQDYANSQGLGVIDGLPVTPSIRARVGYIESDSLQARRTQVRQRITALELQLSLAKAAGNQLLYIASESAARTDKGSSFDTLTLLEGQLAEKRSRLQDNDPLVHRLERQREALIGYINKQTIALLEGELAVARSNYISMKRPKEVIQRHRELTQRALRDEATLVELENNLNKFKLEQARKTDPWDLISTPTLLDDPVSPKPARNLALGLLAGVVLGSGAALVAERRTGLVFALDELRQLLPYPLLASLSVDTPTSWAASLKLLAQGPLAGAVQVALVPASEMVGGDADAVASALQTALQACDPAAQVLLSSDLQLAGRCNAQVLLASLGASSRQQLAQLQQNLLLQGQPVTGVLLLHDAT